MKFKVGDRVITPNGKGVIVYIRGTYYLVSHNTWREGHNNEHLADEVPYQPKHWDKRHWYYNKVDLRKIKKIN